MNSEASSSEGGLTLQSGDLVGLLASFLSLFDLSVLVASRVAIANLGAVGIGVAKAFLRLRLPRLPVFSDQLGVGSLRLVPCLVFPELSADRHLGALGLVEPMLEDVSEPVDGIVDQRDEAFAGQLGALRRLPVVLQIEEAADDLLFASVFHSVPIIEPGGPGRNFRRRWRIERAAWMS